VETAGNMYDSSESGDSPLLGLNEILAGNKYNC
jgi:hypothetical protein